MSRIIQQALRRGLCATLGAWLAIAAPAVALADSASVSALTPVLLACRSGGAERVATRTLVLGSVPHVLLVDAESLLTQLEPADRWSCHPMPEERLGGTRFGRALANAAAAQGTPTGASFYNAGLRRGRGDGATVTADLCPSHRALDRAVLGQMAALGRPAPVALAVAGTWLSGHAADLDWLKERARAGDLAITWVNHSETHRFIPSLTERRNFMLLPGTDVESEILGGERRMIQHGLTPSVFFRFPGLVSDAALLRQVSAHHLVVLGTDAWLAQGQQPHPGSLVLVHLNGNEESGVAALARVLARPGTRLGALPDAP